MNFSNLEIETLYKTIKSQRAEIKELKKELTRLKTPQLHLEIIKNSESVLGCDIYSIYHDDHLVDLYFPKSEEEGMLIFERFKKAYIPTYSVIIRSQRENGIFMKLEKVYSTELCASKENPITKVTYSLTNNKEGLTKHIIETSTQALEIYRMEEFVAKILEDWEFTFNKLKESYPEDWKVTFNKLKESYHANNLQNN